MINVLYRLSDNGYPKEKFEFATKKACLLNTLEHFTAIPTVFVDTTNLTDTTKAFVEDLADKGMVLRHYYIGGSSAGSWRAVFDYVLEMYHDNELVYFIEDDYIHTPNAEKILLEGLERADYVSLYDHNDKYIPASEGGNPFIGDDGGEETKVYLTKSSHWKLSNSTTMSFATSVGQLQKDKDVWEQFTLGTHPNDFGAFIKLRELGRSLITPIPGYATHAEPKWASPLIDWESVIE